MRFSCGIICEILVLMTAKGDWTCLQINLDLKV